VSLQTIPINGNEKLVRMAIKEPVTITAGNEDLAVVLSKTDYNRITRYNLDRLRNYCDETSKEAQNNGITEEKLNAILGIQE
jgi:PHD/YefM family antitoxin component YafN of YafNO toxin-antitoxin module